MCALGLFRRREYTDGVGSIWQADQDLKKKNKKRKKAKKKNHNPVQASQETVQRPGLYCRNATLATFDGTTDYHNHRLLTSFPLFSLRSPPKTTISAAAAAATDNLQSVYKTNQPLREATGRSVGAVPFRSWLPCVWNLREDGGQKDEKC